ncbi:MAG: DUF1206 domain-containing protein [Clostridia bacterium]|nr:DUF1206 domain-containing protein [Clostridia bacterium]
MAGPGGGGNGGGFRGGGGGSFGGFGGGSGGYHRPYHRGPRFYGPGFGMFGFGPRWYRPYYGGYYGGGCLGGLVGLVFLPLFLILFAAIMLFSSVGTAFSAVANGGVVQYDEMKFQSYADSQYKDAFGTGDTSEDNILLVFGLDEERQQPYVIAWVGDNIHRNITNAFGNERTKFGQTVNNNLPTNYDNAMSKSLSNIVLDMGDYIDALNLSSSFDYDTEGQRRDSYLVNKSTLSISEQTVNNALDQFTAQTEIPMVIVVAEAEEIFGKTIPMGSWITIIIALGLIGLAIWLFVRNILDKKQAKKNGYGNGRNQNNSSGGYNNNNGNWNNNGF